MSDALRLTSSIQEAAETSGEESLNLTARVEIDRAENASRTQRMHWLTSPRHRAGIPVPEFSSKETLALVDELHGIVRDTLAWEPAKKSGFRVRRNWVDVEGWFGNSAGRKALDGDSYNFGVEFKLRMRDRRSLGRNSGDLQRFARQQWWNVVGGCLVSENPVFIANHAEAMRLFRDQLVIVKFVWDSVLVDEATTEEFCAVNGAR